MGWHSRGGRQHERVVVGWVGGWVGVETQLLMLGCVLSGGFLDAFLITSGCQAHADAALTAAVC